MPEEAKRRRSTRPFMIPIAAAATLFEIMAGRYIVAIIFGVLLALIVWKRDPAEEAQE